MAKRKLILYLLLPVLQQGFSKKYDNYTLLRGIPANDDQLSFLHNLTKKYDVNFWNLPGLLHKPVEFVVSPLDQLAFNREASELGLYVTTVMEDVQRAFDMQTIKSYVRRKTESFDWQNYYRLDDIYNWLKDLAKANPSVMQIRSIGKTYENRDILAVKINLGNHKSKQPSKKVIMEGGIHAREWVSSAFVTYFINALVHAPYSKDDGLKAIAYMYEWHIVPVLNPDGYEYTHAKPIFESQDRMWRKNRHGQGTDINRNFGYAFGTTGVSFDKSSEIYCGAKAFSEKESIAMASFVKSENKNVEFYFAFHAYGQYMIIPYADSTGHTDNFNEVRLMGLMAAKRLQARHGTKYTVGTAYDTVGYMTSGISGDWVKKSFKVPVVCTFELRDSGHYGFALPPDQILSTCRETSDALVSFLTPRRKGWKNILKENDLLLSGSREASFLDGVVIVCNVLLFIIVRYDYLLVFLFTNWLPCTEIGAKKEKELDSCLNVVKPLQVSVSLMGILN